MLVTWRLRGGAHSVVRDFSYIPFPLPPPISRNIPILLYLLLQYHGADILFILLLIIILFPLFPFFLR